MKKKKREEVKEIIENELKAHLERNCDNIAVADCWNLNEDIASNKLGFDKIKFAKRAIRRAVVGLTYNEMRDLFGKVVDEVEETHIVKEYIIQEPQASSDKGNS